MQQPIAPHCSNYDGSSGYTMWNCDQPQFPILLSVPHAGRVYPAALFDDLRINPAHLLRLEDRYADRLARPAIDAGFPAIIAECARVWIDLNRDEADLDPDMVHDWAGPRPQQGSPKMRGGLGLVPRRLANAGEIWRRPFAKAEIDARIMNYHRPYHAQIERILALMRERFGVAMLVDLHSMPSLPIAAAQQSKIVIGDRFGQCAAPIYAELLTGRLRELGVPVALNNPYPGDYVLRRHGDPRRNIHALQIEVDRALYLDELQHEPAPNLAKTAAIVAELLVLLCEQLNGSALPLAAE
jgi:N-formylglutamate amidohydrolase